MKYLLILGYIFALIFHTNTASSQSIDKAVAETQKLESIESPPQKSAHRIAITHSIDSQRELYRLCKVAQKGNGNTLYYSNGQVMTNWAGREGQTWYYPNGQVMTNWVGREGQTWYYSNGQVMTNWVGREGQTWYHPNGQVMTNWVGREGQTWYHPNGQIMTSSGNLISKQEMLYPCSYIE